MANQLRKSDITDTEFLDQEELTSDGSFVYLTTSVISTTASTKTVVVSLASDGEGLITGEDHPAESGDIVILTGTSGANGQYSIDQVLSDTSFTVVEAILDSTGGSADYHYRAGAKVIGFDPTGLTSIFAHNVQEALAELDASIASSADYLTEAQHPALRQLIHLADEGGPFEGFPTGVYQETTPAGSPFPTSVIWWSSSAKVGKIVEETVSYNPNKTIATDNWKVYNTDGTTMLAEILDTISYLGVFEVSRLRTITDYSVGVCNLQYEEHKTLRQLIHLADEGGPFEGFATGAYQETLPASSPFPTSVIWWTSSAKTSKIVEENITYNPNKTVATDTWQVYAVDGSTVLATVTDTVTYSGVFELYRSRAIS